MTMTRVLVVDDHPIVFQGLAQLLGLEPDMRAEWYAQDSEAAVQVCAQHKPDLAIVDISLAGSSGLSVIKAMRTRWPAMPVVAMSMHEERLYAERVLYAGAMGYVMKRMAPATIIEAIRTVRNGKLYLSVDLNIDPRLADDGGSKPGHGDTLNEAVERFSDRELEIFLMIGQGLKRHDIAASLGCSGNTVDTHRLRIRRKLDASSTNDVARLAVMYAQQRAENHDAFGR